MKGEKYLRERERERERERGWFYGKTAGGDRELDGG